MLILIALLLQTRISKDQIRIPPDELETTRITIEQALRLDSSQLNFTVEQSVNGPGMIMYPEPIFAPDLPACRIIEGHRYTEFGSEAYEIQETRNCR